MNLTRFLGIGDILGWVKVSRPYQNKFRFVKDIESRASSSEESQNLYHFNLANYRAQLTIDVSCYFAAAHLHSIRPVRRELIRYCMTELVLIISECISASFFC